MAEWDPGFRKVALFKRSAKYQNVYDGYKPYWAKLHKKTLYLYYDSTMSELKCIYYMPAISDLEKQGKTKITFVIFSKLDKPARPSGAHDIQVRRPLHAKRLVSFIRGQLQRHELLPHGTPQ